MNVDAKLGDSHMKARTLPLAVFYLWGRGREMAAGVWTWKSIRPTVRGYTSQAVGLPSRERQPHMRLRVVLGACHVVSFCDYVCTAWFAGLGFG